MRPSVKICDLSPAVWYSCILIVLFIYTGRQQVTKVIQLYLDVTFMRQLGVLVHVLLTVV